MVGPLGRLVLYRARRRQSQPDPGWLSAREAAERLGVSAAAIRLWIKNGHLAALKTPGGYYRLRVSDVDALLAPLARGEVAGWQ